MSNPITDSKTFSALNMATDLRQQMQSLQHRAEEVVQQDQQNDCCTVQGLIALISATTLGHSLAQELSHRLHIGEEPKKICPDDCELYCPWFRAAQRIDRWQRELELDSGVYRLALYDFQRGIGMAVSLVDFLEKGLQEADDEARQQNLAQSAGCLSSWMRKLVQLLHMVGEHVGCQKSALRKSCA